MARSPGKGGGGSSRIRFIMIEADIAEGDFHQITQAIQNAVKPPQIQKVRIGAPRAVNTSTNDESAELEADGVEFNNSTEQEAESASEKPAKNSTIRRYPTPKAVTLDIESGTSLNDFISGKDLKSQKDRFLVAAAYLSEVREMEEFGIGHIYTCFRHMGWPANIKDWNKPAQNLKQDQLFSGENRGIYTLTQLGSQRVKKMKTKTDAD